MNLWFNARLSFFTHCFLFQRQDKSAAELAKRHVSKEEIDEILSYVPKDKRPPIIHDEFLILESKMMEIVMKLPRYKP